MLSNPEFLAEGTAVENLVNADRVLIGHNETPTGRAAFRELRDIYMRWIPKERIIGMKTWSSELSKLVCVLFIRVLHTEIMQCNNFECISSCSVC